MMTIDDISWFFGGVILRIPKFFSPLVNLLPITVVACAEDFIAVTTRRWGAEKLRVPCIEFSETIKKGEAKNACLSSFMPNTSREFLESIKKGRISNPTPRGTTYGNHPSFSISTWDRFGTKPPKIASICLACSVK